MKTGETRGYVLTFRCINCGRHDVFAQYPTEHITPEDRIRERIYQVTCNSCGWSGDVCGLRPFVFRIRKSLKRGLPDTDSVCDAPGCAAQMLRNNCVQF